MLLRCYQPKNFRQATLAVIEKVNGIVEQYAQMGFDLTLRQVYYQMVARGHLPNKQTEYDRLGQIVADGRLAGLIPWDRIVDRTRNRRSVSHWTSPSDIISAQAFHYRIDKWKGQEWRPWVWIEKEALVGVIEPVCRELDVSWFACRGYVSLSEMWAAAREMPESQKILLVHLGDHDPSGIDMTRDIRERFQLFERWNDRVRVKRIALNMPQIEEMNPPPNPAKETDSRFGTYLDTYGEESWELDALPPDYIENIIRETILEVRDDEKWGEQLAKEKEQRRLLRAVSENWTTIADETGDRITDETYDEPEQDPAPEHQEEFVPRGWDTGADGDEDEDEE